MASKINQEILDELIPSLEALEARSAAVLEFLKKEGIATDEKLAPHLEQAASASNIRWLAVRVRMERLLSSVEKETKDQKSRDIKSEDRNSAEKEVKRQETAAEDKPTKAANPASGAVESEDKPKSTNDKKPSGNGDNTRPVPRQDADTKPVEKTQDGGPKDDKRDEEGERKSESTATTSADTNVA